LKTPLPAIGAFYTWSPCRGASRLFQPESPIWPCSARSHGIERAGGPQPALSSFSTGPQEPCSRGAGCHRCPTSEFAPPRGPFQRHPRSVDLTHALAPLRGPRSGRVPRQSLDAPNNLPEQARRQVALGELQDEVPGVPDQAPPVLKSRCWRLVRDQPWMAWGRASRRRRFPRLYAMTPKSSRTSFARKR
jgi:hypothetical protein